MPSASQFLLEQLPRPAASPRALVAMFMMLAASTWVFVMLVRRETLRKRWTTIVQWAKSRGLRPVNLSDEQIPNSPICAALAAYHPKPAALLQGAQISLGQVATDPTPTAAAIKPVWHLLSRNLETAWPVTGLRPTGHTNSVIDLFSLSSFPSLMPPDRFVIFGTDANAARALAWSTIAALLPADIGLLLHGKVLILDFTSRHFDEVEFGRVLEIAEQLVARVNSAAVR